MTDPARPYTDDELRGDGVCKKDLVMWLQANSSNAFQQEHKLKGQLKSVSKTKSKDSLVAAYNTLFITKEFRKEGEDAEAEAAAKEKAKVAAEKLEDKAKKLSLVEHVEVEKPKYSKKVLKKGDRTNFPTKGETVACWYTGRLADGKVFDTNVVTGRKAKSAQPLRFKVGTGKVIRGWDEVLMTMSVGEKSEVVIEPDWAYGRKGTDGIPPNSTLTFEIELAGLQ